MNMGTLQSLKLKKNYRSPTVMSDFYTPDGKMKNFNMWALASTLIGNLPQECRKS